MRKCVVSGEVCYKKDLIRVVRTPEGNVIVDRTGKANGRGAYIKKDLEILKKAQKSKVLEKHLEVKIDNEIYEELERIKNQTSADEGIRILSEQFYGKASQDKESDFSG